MYIHCMAMHMLLTHWGWDKMDAISQTTFSNAFPWMKENIRIPINISLKFVAKVPINNIPALVQIMAWRRPGDKPLSEPMMVSLLTHICVTRPQWVNGARWLAKATWHVKIVMSHSDGATDGGNVQLALMLFIYLFFVNIHVWYICCYRKKIHD